MKKRQFSLVSAVILCSALLFFFGCKKEKDTELEFDIQIPQDNSLAEATFNDIQEISNQAIENGAAGLTTYRLPEVQGSFLSTCATVTLTPDSSGQGGTIVVDFGSYSCKCTDLRYRKGVINISYTDNYHDSGAVMTTTLQNYFVGIDSTNMYQVMGTKTVTNKGHNTLGHLWFTVDVNGQLRNKNNATMDWTSQRQREWIAGESTRVDYSDDVYSITGSANGTTFEGRTYSANITNALIFKLNCRYIVQGTFELTPTGLATRVLDYGGGTCDAFATVTVNGSVFNITLR